MAKIVGKRTLSVQVPADLYVMFSKFCMDSEVSRTEAIVKYLKWIQKQPVAQRRLLNATSKADIGLDGDDEE